MGLYQEPAAPEPTAPATPEPTAPASPAPTAPAAPAPVPQAPDPFGFDESALANLPPEQKAALDPVLKQWKDKASETLKRETEGREGLDKKAKALDKLINDPRFQEWYQGVNSPKEPEAPEPPKNPLPSPEEWTAAANDPKKWAELQVRHTKAVLEQELGSKIKEFDTKQKDIELSIEFDQAIRKHKDFDVWDYDKEEVGLLEPLLYYHKDHLGKGVDAAFEHIKKIEGFFKKKFAAEQAAAIAQKKSGTTEAPTPSGHAPNVEYADSPSDMLRRQIKASMQGRNVQVVLRK